MRQVRKWAQANPDLFYPPGVTRSPADFDALPAAASLDHILPDSVHFQTMPMSDIQEIAFVVTVMT